MKPEEVPVHSHLIVKKPAPGRKKWSIACKNLITGKWTTLNWPEIDAVNETFVAGVLPFEQAEIRVKKLLEQLYVLRDAKKPAATFNLGNDKIVSTYIDKYYSEDKKYRLDKSSVASAVYSLRVAVKDLGNLPIDGDKRDLQGRIDRLYHNNPGKHKKRVTAVNRVRKFLNLEPIENLPPQDVTVAYVTKAQLDQLLPFIRRRSNRVLAAVLFYTGLRVGEAFALTEQDILLKKDSMKLLVNKQLKIDGTLGPTKTRHSRIALVIPGGEDWVREWVGLEDRASMRKNKLSDVVKNAAFDIGVKDFYLHALRHSYCIHMLGKGVPIRTVAQSAGHSVAVCERYYSGHRLSEEAADYAEEQLRK
jgi:integrase